MRVRPCCAYRRGAHASQREGRRPRTRQADAPRPASRGTGETQGIGEHIVR
jgi:hypothetical protein